ncbi:hypothetical protein SAMN02746041_00968 [Desulfacinum hydrothermale DSM 13146]|uniref:Magnetosome protein MamS/MamX domain-containing protein n=1 Tax=Desulfacinum hydrothermale DSM 13146 TaxID=1121390 RepID=A0A1W1X9S5_9BACT|nr:hypothetical protein [Desulfacinum hydrothermale]SMC20613.1 hypothetical protein SAMN02746041_00968 [Desulfacinum hydrothermale DSM 13146]
MERCKHIRVLWIFLALSLWMGAAPTWAQTPLDMGGWEKGGAYDRLYDPQERDKFKATVLAIKEVVPLEGMSPGVALVVQDRDGEEILVHLGPRWFIDPNTMGIRVGDKVKVYGAWAELDDKDVFIASKVKKSDHFQFKVRLTRDGTPFWTLSPEEVAKERAGE